MNAVAAKNIELLQWMSSMTCNMCIRKFPKTNCGELYMIDQSLLTKGVEEESDQWQNSLGLPEILNGDWELEKWEPRAEYSFSDAVKLICERKAKMFAKKTNSGVTMSLDEFGCAQLYSGKKVGIKYSDLNELWEEVK